MMAYVFRFECSHGTKEQQDDIKRRCIAAEPKHGDLWCKYAKNIQHWKEKTEFFLIIAASELKPPN